MVTTPVADPNAAGLNVTEIVHFLPANTVLPQVLVSANGPVTVMPLMDNVAVPVLVGITFLAALVVPTATLPKVRVVAERVTFCALAAAVSNRNASARCNSTSARRLEKANLADLLTKRMAKTGSLHDDRAAYMPRFPNAIANCLSFDFCMDSRL